MSSDSFSYSSVTASFKSDWIDVRHYKNVSVQVNNPGTIAGTVYLEASNDKATGAAIEGASKAITSGVGAIIEVVDVCSLYVRACLTLTSGSGAVTIAVGKKV